MSINVQDNLKMYFVKLVGTRKGDDPHFQFEHKVGDAYEIFQPGQYAIKSFQGNLEKIERTTYTFEGDEIVNWNFYLRDDESQEKYRLQMNVNAFFRELVNRLSWLATEEGKIDFVRFGVYSGTFKGDDGVDREGRGFYVHSDVQKALNKYAWRDLTDLIKVHKVAGKEIKDMTGMNDFFEKKLEEEVIPALILSGRSKAFADNTAPVA